MNTATFEDIEETCNYLVSRIDVNSSLGAVVHLLYRCGLRIEEACELKRFALDPNFFVVDTEKKSLNRTFDIFLLPPAYFQLLASAPIIPELWVISSPSSVTRYVLQQSPKIFYKDRKRITTNIFRYYYVRKLQKEGFTIEQIQLKMGHSNIASTLSYLAPIYYR